MKGKSARLLAAAALAAMLLGGCGAASGDAPQGSADTAANGGTAYTSAGEGYYGGANMAPQAEEAKAEAPWEEGEALQDAKLIRTGTLELETTDFDGAVEALNGLVAEHGGYLESGSLSNQGGGYRSAEYTVRVPAERFRAFFTRAGELCRVAWQDEATENVTTAYYDTEGRLKTQQTKLERLQTLLARAESMEDIITIEAAISETEQAIELLAGELRHYDALVDYATVRIYLREVYKLSGTEEPPASFAGRLGASFTSGWRAFVDVLEDLAVAVAYGWMWLALLAVVLAFALRRARRKREAAPQVKRPPFWTPGRKKTDDKGPEG